MVVILLSNALTGLTRIAGFGISNACLISALSMNVPLYPLTSLFMIVPYVFHTSMDATSK